MTKCDQCNTPALWVVSDECGTEIPLCLSCYAKYSSIIQNDIENNEREINYLTSSMESISGIPHNYFPRYPSRPIPITISGIKMNNIHVSNSVIGTINTGSIGTIDQTISALIQLGEVSIATAVKELTEAIINSSNLTPNQKNKLVETISFVSTEAATPKENRKTAIGVDLLDNGLKIIKVADDLFDVYQKYWPILVSVFS